MIVPGDWPGAGKWFSLSHKYADWDEYRAPAKGFEIHTLVVNENRPIRMTPQEKQLYHQIHPLKLFVDWSTGIVALYLLWQQDLPAALLIAFVPSIVVSLALVRFSNLEKYKESRFGRYIRRYMTRPLEALRFAGYAVMALGAWFHWVWLIPLGLLVILLAWFRGVLFPHSGALAADPRESRRL